MQLSPPPDRHSRFPLLFELLMWGLYVGLYKYSFYLSDAAALHRPTGRYMLPYPQLMLFAGLATLYVLPFYRWLLPTLLRRHRYGLLLGAVPYLWWGIKLNTWLAAAVFAPMAAPPLLADFYQRFVADWPQLWQLRQPHLQLLFTDALAFGCVALARLAFAHEQRRRLLERDHLALQLAQLKSQLQPHFLFNTLNSIYGLSLAGSPETPRFILLLSELMRYVLYDSGREYITLAEEVTFLENYFEMEQRKYAGASITFAATGAAGSALLVPPLLLLPLVENSFKHGRHHFSDQASVTAVLTATPGGLHFVVENDRLPEMPAAAPGVSRSGGIGLVNIRQRLQLYYPSAHELVLTEREGKYRAELTLKVS